jgi:hypothetical protein
LAIILTLSIGTLATAIEVLTCVLCYPDIQACLCMEVLHVCLEVLRGSIIPVDGYEAGLSKVIHKLTMVYNPPGNYHIEHKYAGSLKPTADR